MTDIYGIGPSLWKKIKPLLRGRKFEDCYTDPEIYELLPISTRAFMKYRPVEKLKRSLLVDIAKKIESIGGTVAGSFRRGAEFCRDLDILIKKKDIINLFKVAKFTKPHAEGEEVIRCFIKIKEVYMFVDIFIYSKKIYPFMLLYTTGSKQFNRIMRGVAKTRGLKLNQHGLYRGEELIDKLETEKDIFDFLEMRYLEPHERNL